MPFFCMYCATLNQTVNPKLLNLLYINRLKTKLAINTSYLRDKGFYSHSVQQAINLVQFLSDITDLTIDKYSNH